MYTVSQKRFPTFVLNFKKALSNFINFYGRMLLKKQAVERCISFLILLSVLRCIFYVNAVRPFANEHKYKTHLNKAIEGRLFCPG